MALGVPVLARNIPGNSALIKHRETGLLFNTPEVCNLEMCDWYHKKSDAITSLNNVYGTEAWDDKLCQHKQCLIMFWYMTCNAHLMKFYFSTMKEFVSLAKELKKSPSLYYYLTRNATKYVSEHHSTEVEKKTYKELLEKLVPYWQLDQRLQQLKKEPERTGIVNNHAKPLCQ